jgi:5-methylcytosine-specific restriction endonuclease McrA
MKQCNICGEEKELSEFAIIRPKKSGGFTYSSRCKKCHAKLAYAARKQDPEKIAKDRKNQAEWLEKNKEHRKEYERKKAKEYWQQQKGKTENKKAANARVKKYRDEGKRKEWEQEQRATNPEYVALRREYSRTRTLRRKAVGGSHTLAEWKALKAQYDHKCLCCGKAEPEVELTRDHIIAITKGGTDDIENIQPLCRGCNAQKQTSQIDFRK